MTDAYYLYKDGTKKKISEMSRQDLRNSLKDEITICGKNFSDSATEMSNTIEKLDEQDLKYLLANHVQNPNILKSRLALESKMIPPGQIKFYL